MYLVCVGEGVCVWHVLVGGVCVWHVLVGVCVCFVCVGEGVCLTCVAGGCVCLVCVGGRVCLPKHHSSFWKKSQHQCECFGREEKRQGCKCFICSEVL